MRKITFSRILRGISRRIAIKNRITIFRAERLGTQPATPESYNFLRIKGGGNGDEIQIIVNAMRDADIPIKLVIPRLEHGDEFIGWLYGDRVVSFGWINYKSRSVGPICMNNSVGRAFLYNFNTLEAHRGKQLFTSLKLMIRYLLGNEGYSEFISDVNVENIASTNGNYKSGFIPVGQLTFWLLFTRWYCCPSRIISDDSVTNLF